MIPLPVRYQQMRVEAEQRWPVQGFRPEPELRLEPVAEPELPLVPVAGPELHPEPLAEPELLLEPVAEPFLPVECLETPDLLPAAWRRPRRSCLWLILNVHSLFSRSGSTLQRPGLTG